MLNIKYDTKNNKPPYLKFKLIDDVNFYIDCNFLTINSDKYNDDNKKLFYIIDNDITKIYPYMYYSNGMYLFRKSIDDFEEIDISKTISLFVVGTNILKSVTRVTPHLAWFGFATTPSVQPNNSLTWIGEQI